MNLDDLRAERERLAAYGFYHALALVDAEIERMAGRKDAAPAERQAPARQTAVAPTKSANITKQSATRNG